MRCLLLSALAAGCSPSKVGLGGDSADDTAAPAPGEVWSETLWCEDMTDLSDLEAAYDPADVRGAAMGIAARRYPPAEAFIEVQDDTYLDLWFTGADGSFAEVLDRFEVAVHEGSHIWDFTHLGATWPYRVVDDAFIVETASLDNFDRSAILERHPDPGADFYASTYLEGQSGAQGFNTLLDEYNAYAHSLVTRFCTRDTLRGSTSARDGILTMMLYVEIYLAIAREEHADDYAAILADPGHVALILSVWDRAESWLAITEGYPDLGIDDASIAAWVYDPTRLDEIDRVAEAAR